MAQQIKVNGGTEEVTDTSLYSLQSLVGGYIEIVPTNDGRLMVVDEEGRLKAKLVNMKATALTRGTVAAPIVGDVVVANEGEIE